MAEGNDSAVETQIGQVERTGTQASAFMGRRKGAADCEETRDNTITATLASDRVGRISEETAHAAAILANHQGLSGPLNAESGRSESGAPCRSGRTGSSAGRW